MDKKDLEKILPVFKLYPEIKLAYLFGSRVNNKTGPLSDYDFAFYLDENDKKKMAEIKLDLSVKISSILGSDKIDIVILNTNESPELKYNIIKAGKLIFEEEPFKILVEPKILTEYFDFRLSLLRHNLIKA